MRKLKGLKDVVDWHLCIGCGACYYACERGEVELVNIPDRGIRPQFKSDACASCTQCLEICPGATLDANLALKGLDSNQLASNGTEEYGAALEIWEGYAADPEIRHHASSGGLLTALSLYCLERREMEFVLHAAMSTETPWLNQTVKSRSRAELLPRTGSRYATSSPCEGLGEIEAANAPCVFIGKPCDAAAAFKLRAERPELAEKLGVILSFFCAGTPSTQGTLDLMEKLGVEDRDSVTSVRYRGRGWPGHFHVESGDETQAKITYDESWSFLTGYRPLRCNLCPDGLARLADLSCGDAWNEFSANSEDDGRSLVLVRTELGREILHGAIQAGYVSVEPSNHPAVLEAQKNLLRRRRELYGRLRGMKLAGMPTPRFANFSLKASWSKLSFKEKLRTVLGTTRRMFKKGFWKRAEV